MDIKKLILFAVCIFTQNIFADETIILKNIAPPSEDHSSIKNLSMKEISNITVQYIYPNNNYRKEILSTKNRTGRYLYMGMEDANDAVLIFPNIINDTATNIHEKNDTIPEKIDTEIESKSIEVDNTEYHSKNKFEINRSKKKTGETPSKNHSTSIESETKNSKLRERLANLSKTRFKNLKNAKPKSIESSTEFQLKITDDITTEETVIEKQSLSPNTSQILLQDKIFNKNDSMGESELKLYRSIRNGTMNITNLLTSDSVIEKQSVSLNATEISFQDKIHTKNGSSSELEPKLFKDTISETVESTELPIVKTLTNESAAMLVLDTSFGKSVLPNIANNDDTTFEARSLIDSASINKSYNESNTTSFIKSSVLNDNTSRKHEIPNFHVEMIPFTIDDVMITSGSESNNYWATPEDRHIEKKIFPSQKMIENILKIQVSDARRRIKKSSNLQKRKVFSKNEKYMEKSSNKLEKNSFLSEVNEEKQSNSNTLLNQNSLYSNQGAFNLHDKNMNEAHIPSVNQHIPRIPSSETIYEELSPFQYSYAYEKKVDTAMFDESSKELLWYKNLQYYIPIEQSVPSRVGDLLIVGPIPKSLPSQFKYEPYKDQMQLPAH